MYLYVSLINHTIREYNAGYVWTPIFSMFHFTLFLVTLFDYVIFIDSGTKSDSHGKEKVINVFY